MFNSNQYNFKSITSLFRWFKIIALVIIAIAIIPIAIGIMNLYHIKTQFNIQDFLFSLTIISVISANIGINIGFKQLYPNSKINNQVSIYMITFILLSTILITFATITIAPILFTTTNSFLQSESIIIMFTSAISISMIFIFIIINNISKRKTIIPLIISIIPFIINTLILGATLDSRNNTSYPPILFFIFLVMTLPPTGAILFIGNLFLAENN